MGTALDGRGAAGAAGGGVTLSPAVGTGSGVGL